MTKDAEILAQCNALNAAYAAAGAFDEAREEGEKLDAYGHLEWTVGNEDWLACFDAIRTPEGIAYHVVVDCESGGWIDTMDSGTIAVNDANAVENLCSLPDYWAGVCWENYYDRPEKMHPSEEDVADCTRRWREHLMSLVAQEAPEAGETSDEYGTKASHNG